MLCQSSNLLRGGLCLQGLQGNAFPQNGATSAQLLQQQQQQQNALAAMGSVQQAALLRRVSHPCFLFLPYTAVGCCASCILLCTAPVSALLCCCYCENQVSTLLNSTTCAKMKLYPRSLIEAVVRLNDQSEASIALHCSFRTRGVT